MLMAAARLNLPSVFDYGASILPGHLDGRALDIVSVFEAVAREVAGRDLVPARRHPHLGLVPVVVGHPDRPQHRPGRGPPGPVGDLVAAGLHVLGHISLAVSADLGLASTACGGCSITASRRLTGPEHDVRR
jgi:hypothetical protein